MNKNTFLSELSRKLRGLQKADYDDAMNYYIEYFMDAGVDELSDVTPLVGTVDEVSRRILDECTEKQVTVLNEKGGVKNNTKAIWYLILGICAAPIALPLAIAAVAVVIAVFATIFGVFIALIASSVGVVIAGVAALPGIFWAKSVAQVLVILGLALMAIAFGVMMSIAFYKICELIIKLVIKIVRFFSSKSKKNNTAKASTDSTNGATQSMTGDEQSSNSGSIYR